jgi:hypothetical protein
MLCAGGWCALSTATRFCTAWGKFKKLLPILTSKHLPLTTRVKHLMHVYSVTAWKWNNGPPLTYRGSAGMREQWSAGSVGPSHMRRHTLNCC